MRKNAEPLDTHFMKEVLKEARKGLGNTSPNPMVGALIVKDGKILARGYHRRAGAPHAEADALSKLGGRSEGAALYVNLEPCNHYGRTPPCTEAILAAGIARVVIAMKDPNPDVKGGGCAYLRAKGLDITEGVLEKEARQLNEVFIKYSKTKKPFVTLKSAITLDGWCATSSGHSKWVTNERSRAYVHRLRAFSDAVLVGVGTVIADDPQLTVRAVKGRNPLRIVVDTSLRTPYDARVVRDISDSGTLIAVGPGVKAERLIKMTGRGVEVIRCPEADGRIDLAALLERLGKMSVTSLLVEGGAEIAGAFLRGRLVDKLVVFLAAKLLAGGDGLPMAGGPGALSMDRCLRVADVRVKNMGGDIMITGYPAYAGIAGEDK